MIASNLGQIIGQRLPDDWTPRPLRIETIEPVCMKVAPKKYSTKAPPGSIRDALVKALQEQPGMNMVQLHARVGGGRQSLCVLVSAMRQAGSIKTEGKKGQYRYSLA